MWRVFKIEIEIVLLEIRMKRLLHSLYTHRIIVWLGSRNRLSLKSQDDSKQMANVNRLYSRPMFINIRDIVFYSWRESKLSVISICTQSFFVFDLLSWIQ